jgi:hypothetical protein
VILPLFWAAKAGGQIRHFAESKFHDNGGCFSAAVFRSSFAGYAGEDPGPDHGRSYDTLKARLLETRTLLDQEKMDILFTSKPLSGRKPSHLLANMLAYCSSNMEQSVMFQYTVCSCSVCRSPCGHCWENRSLVTSKAWPLGHWWPIWQWPRSSLQLRLQPSRGRSLNVRRSFPERSLEANRRPLAASRRHLVLILVALLILSRLGLVFGPRAGSDFWPAVSG